MADTGNNAVKKIASSDGTLTTLTSGLLQPIGLARDAAGNAYAVAFTGSSVLKIWLSRGLWAACRNDSARKPATYRIPVRDWQDCFGQLDHGDDKPAGAVK